MEKKDSIRPSCVDCAVTGCISGGKDGPYPAFCISRHLEKDQADAALRQYVEDPEDQQIVQAAEYVLAAGYEKWPRVQEVVAFARQMGYRKIGIATCTALIRESRILARILRANGFEVYGVGCKVGEMDKSNLGVPLAYQSMGTVACNPVLQARLLEEAGTELNIVMGLCVGHDILFSKHSRTPSTTLVVKDRVLVHNPVMALYTVDGYYSHLLRPMEEPAE